MKLEEINSLSELLELAIIDIEFLVYEGKFKPVMETWLRRRSDGIDTCEGCLAGAVLYREHYNCNVPPEYDYLYESLSEEIENRLTALNSLRLGDIQDGAKWMEISIPKQLRYPHIMNTADFSDLLYEWRKLLTFLKEHGL